jgi:hypothetical protein
MFLPNISTEELVQKIIDFTNFEANYDNLDELFQLVSPHSVSPKGREVAIEELKK